jgi:hypothetical protein
LAVAADARGSADGVYHGNPVLGGQGALLGTNDTAVVFDGVDDYVEVPFRAANNPVGSFSVEAWVQLSSGGSTTADGRTPAMTAVRVIYELPVPVPDLEGLTVEEAQAEIDEAGLVLAVEYGGGLLEDLLPGDPGVCEQDPEPDTEVRRGTTVDVAVEKSC